MSNYDVEFEPNPTHPLVALTTKIETLVENEPVDLALSALFSALLRLESAKCGGSTRTAAMRLVCAFKNLVRTCEN